MILNELPRITERSTTSEEDIEFFKNMQPRSDELRRDIKKIKNTITSFQESFDKKKIASAGESEIP